MSSSESASPTSSSSAAATTSASASLSAGSNLKVVGIILAVASGVLIGSSFVFKKKGLLRSQAGQTVGEGVAYLKSPLWWLGMIMMILGELCNFAAYAFVEALVVTPLGALSVVICAILSSFFLKEKLTFFGWLGCAQCIIGSVIIALNGPKEESIGQIREFQKLFLAPGFIAYVSVLVAISLVIIFYFAPKYGKKSMLWYISVCSMIGGISVSVTTGLGAAIVTTAKGDNQFKYWFMYFLMAFVVITLLTEIYYLNVALALFNTAMVTPTYYVIFTFFSMVTTVVLFQGLKASAAQIITIAMAFLTICIGITILQMSKVDPVELSSKLDRRSTILLQAARSNTEAMEEKGPVGMEDPGMDALRGSFGAIGSIVRMRSGKRMSQSSRASSYRSRPPGAAAPYNQQDWGIDAQRVASPDGLFGMKRHQLYDAPVPRPEMPVKSPSLLSTSNLPPHRQTIKFDDQDLVHQYHPPGTGDNSATHQQRSNSRNYPPRTPSDVGSSSLRSVMDDGGVSREQTLVVPPSPEDHYEHDSSRYEPRSAPPTVSRTESGFGVNVSSLYSNAPSTGTMRSFPSVTDSSPSASYLDVDDDRGRSRNSSATNKSGRYPKGSKEDDREESVRLWGRDSEDSGESGHLDDDAPPAHGGIRLVQSKPRY